MFASICPFIDFCPRDAMSNAVIVVAVCLSSDSKLSCCTKVQLALSLWTSLPQVRGESIALATFVRRKCGLVRHGYKRIAPIFGATLICLFIIQLLWRCDHDMYGSTSCCISHWPK